MDGGAADRLPHGSLLSLLYNSADFRTKCTLANAQSFPNARSNDPLQDVDDALPMAAPLSLRTEAPVASGSPRRAEDRRACEHELGAAAILFLAVSAPRSFLHEHALT